MSPLGRGRCALYHRGSRLDQDPKAALRDLRASAERLGLRVILRIEETGSGALNDRPGLLRVLEAAQHRDVDAVIVWKLDRFGRSPLDVLSNIQKLTRRGVRFLVPLQGIDVRPGGDALTLLVLEMLVQVNIEIMRAFVRLRRMLKENVDLARKLAALEKRYDAQFKIVFDAIRELMEPTVETARPIGLTKK